MKYSIRSIAGAAFVLLLAACAGPVPKQDASADKLAHVKTVTVIRAPEPKTYTIMYFGHPGMMFGAIGGLAAGLDMQSKSDQISAAMHEHHSAVSAHIADDIASDLRSEGFDAHVEDGPWQEKDGKYTIEYDKIQSTTDAVLVPAPTIVGFIAPRMGSDYLPTVTVVATLLEKGGKQQIYRGYHAYGWKPKADGWRFTQPAATFADFTVLMADPQAAVASLDAGAEAVAKSVAADLRH